MSASETEMREGGREGREGGREKEGEREEDREEKVTCTYTLYMAPPLMELLGDP